MMSFKLKGQEDLVRRIKQLERQIASDRDFAEKQELEMAQWRARCVDLTNELNLANQNMRVLYEDNLQMRMMLGGGRKV